MTLLYRASFASACYGKKYLMLCDPGRGSCEQTVPLEAAASCAQIAHKKWPSWVCQLVDRPAFRNAFLLFLVNGLMGVVGVATRIMIANSLGLTDFGVIAYALAIGSCGATVIRFGRDKTLMRDLIHYPEEYNYHLASSVILNLGLVLVGCVALFLYALCFGHGMPLGAWLIIVSASLLSVNMQPVFDSWNRMGEHAVYTAINGTISNGPIWLIYLVAPQWLSVTLVGVAMLWGVAIALSLEYREVVKRTQLVVFTRRSLLGAAEMFRANISVALASCAAVMFGPVIQIILRVLKGPAELGVYAVGAQFVFFALFILSQIARIGNPAIARITKQGVPLREKRGVLQKYILVLLLGALPIALPSILVPDLITRTLFKPEYASAAGVLPILGVYVLVLAIGVAAAQFVVSSRYEKSYLAAVVAGNATGLVLCAVLIPVRGAVGAAWVLLLSHSTSMLIYCLIAIRSLILATRRDCP